MQHILHTLRSKWAHSHGSKLHKSEQKLFIMTGRWYCRQKWLLTLWKYGCSGLTEADFYFFFPSGLREILWFQSGENVLKW